MAEIYRLPAVSPTMEVGTLAAWRLQEGEAFTSGVVVAEIGTDKATMEAEIFDDGVLLRRLVEEGDDVPVNAPIAILGAAGEDITALEAEARAELKALASGGAAPPAPQAEPPAVAAAPAVPEAAPAPPPAASAAAPAPAGRAPDVGRTWMGQPLSPLFADPPGDLRAGSRAVKASPLARKHAAAAGIDLSVVRGSGPGGRVVVADVEAASARPRTAAPQGAARDDVLIKHSQMRRTIAKRLLASHAEIPTFFLTVDLDGEGMVRLRQELKARQPDVKVSFNDVILAAVARALREHPDVNATWGKDGITQFGRVDLGLAVALDGGLITPVIRGADQLGLAALAAAARDLAGRARDGALSPEEYQGNTFTVSNLGMMQIQHFTAIINPPASAILAVGALEAVPVVEGGAVVVRQRVKATMTCDHRVIDGAVGARFLQTVRRYVEAPVLLLL